MARPERNNVDYFPFLCKEGKAMYYIEQKYGNDGYSTWIKILRQLAVTNYHYLNLSNRVEFMFLASKCRVSEEVLSAIISDLCELGEFNKMLWEQNKIIYNEKFIESIKDAYLKRNNKCISLNSLLLLLSSLGVRKLHKGESEVPDNPHRREEYSIEEKKRKDFIDRKLKFSETLKPYLNIYGKDFLNDFYEYWTEPNKSETKFKMELEDTWSLKRRLNTWDKNNSKKYFKNGALHTEQHIIYTESSKPKIDHRDP